MSEAVPVTSAASGPPVVSAPAARTDALPSAAVAVGLGLAGLVLWSHWPAIPALVREWRNDENYSIGMLVPVAAAYLLWQKRAALARVPVAPSWWGVPVLLAGEGLRGFGLITMRDSLERCALVLAICGTVLLVAGRDVFRRIFWILAFLLLMVPLPAAVHNRISGPLQGLATSGAVYVLEMAGVGVARDGHVMTLNDRVEVAVAEACSGLRMLTAFVVVAALMALTIRKPAWQKVVLLVSSVPVAIVCNLVRLVATALLLMVVGSEVAERFFHDFAGLTMMPLAIVLLLGELWLMSALIIEESHGRTGPGL